MKKARYTFFLLAVLLLSSCIAESFEKTDEDIQEMSGVMEIGIKEKGGKKADKLHTIRFFVFKDVLISPKLELNTLENMPDVAENDEVTEFNVLLEVSRRVNGPNEKMVFAIVNEPAQMTNRLDQITTYAELENLQLEFAHFLNNSHTGLETGKGLPMTGIVQTNKVYATVAEAKANRANLTLERAVARVDIYIRKEVGCGIDLKAASKVTLERSYDKSYLIRHTDINNWGVFGKKQTVNISDYLLPSKTTFTQAGRQDIPVVASGEDGYLICSFYTPERTCSTDAERLVVKLDILSTDGDNRTGEVMIKNFEKENEGIKPVEDILRNNVYRIIATAKNNLGQVEFMLRYVQWEPINQSIIFD